MIQKLTGWITPQRLQGNLNVVPTEVGGASLQAKTAWPSHSEQTIKPDDDYDGLALVVVKPVPKIKTAEARFFDGVEGFKTAIEIGTATALYEKTEV